MAAMRSLLAVLILVAFALGSPARGDPALTIEELRQILGPMAQAERRVQDAVYILHRREWVDSALQPQQLMAVKWRRPRDVYLRWVGDIHAGREVLYSPGANGGLVFVSVGSMVPTLTLEPTSSVLMRGQRHGLSDVGPSFPVKMVMADLGRATANPDHPARAIDLGLRTVVGEQARCFHAYLPRHLDPQYYAEEAEICVGTRLHLPVSFKVWEQAEGRLQLVEDFAFEGMRVNVGLTDADFTPEHPDYGF